MTMRFNPTALMGNNPIVQLVNTVRGGADPNALIQQMIINHPQRAQIQRIVNGKTPDQLMGIAENMCKECGITIDDVLRQFGIER